MTATVGTTRRALKLSLSGTTSATLIMYGCNLLLVPVLLHRIGIDLYGAWATVASLLAVGGLADAGIRTEIVRRVALAQGAGDDADLAASVHRGVTILFGLAAVLLVIGALAAPAMRSFVFPAGVRGYSHADVEWLVRGAVLLLCVELVASGYFAVLRGVQRTDAESLAFAVSLPVGVLATVGGVVAGWGLWALLIGSAVQQAVSMGIQALRVRQLVPGLRFRIVRLDRPTARGFAVLGGLALMSQIGDVVDTQWDKVVLSRYVGSGAVASFQIGTTLSLQAKALALIPVAPMLVAVAELRHTDKARRVALLRQLGRVGSVAAASILGAVFVFAPAFVHLWLGDSASPQIAEAARIFAGAVAINLWGAPFALTAIGRRWHGLAAISSGANIAVNGVASLVLTLHIGFRGPLFGSLLGNFAGVALFAVIMRRRMGAEWARRR